MNAVLEILLYLTLLLDISTAHSEFRIILGENVSIEKHPHQVSMRWTYGTPQPMHFCGGSIISETHIVTAAHCVDDKRTPDLMKHIKIYTGTSRTDTAFEGNVYEVKKITIHPTYVGQSDNFLNDIAVVTLVRQITFDNSQKAIRLPTQDVISGEAAVITGWGDTRHHPYGETATILQEVDMKVITKSECQEQIPFSLENSQICGINSRGAGVCSGDSGGPLVASGALVGIASYVVDCGKGYPDVYTKVFSHISFIREVIYQVFESGSYQEPNTKESSELHYLDEPDNDIFGPYFTEQSNDAYIPAYPNQPFFWDNYYPEFYYE